MAYESTVLCHLPSGVLVNGATINETSGIVDSRRHPSVFWIHEDSDAATVNAWFYAVGHDGTLRKIIRLTGFTNITGGPELFGEWEDCAYHASTNSIYVGNFGNNDNSRSEFWVYRFTEPADISDPTTVLDVPLTGQWRFRFPDAPAGLAGWNCETMIVRPSGRLFFVNKAAAADTALYAAPETLSTTSVNVLQRVANWTAQANITGGDWASDNSGIYISGGNLRGFKYAPESPWSLLEEFVLADPVATGNPEALCVTRDNRFLLRTSEGGSAEVVRIALPVAAPAQPTKVEWWISETERLEWATVEPTPLFAVPGGTFETAGDEALWATTGSPTNTITREQVLTPLEGSWYGLLTINAATGNHNFDSSPIDITDLDVIPELRAAARWKTAGPHNVRMDYRFFSDAGGTVGLSPATYTGISTATSTTEWTEFYHPSMSKPAGAVSMRVRLTDIGGVSGAAVAYDNIGGDHIEPDPDPDPPTNTDALVALANLPVNDADAAVQRGDFSGFTTVTTFAQLRDAMAAGDWVRVDSTINCTGQLLVRTGAALYIGPNGKVLKTYTSTGASTTAFVRTAQLTGGTGYYNEIVPSHNVYIGGPGELGDRVGSALGGNIIGIGGDNFVMDGIRGPQFGGGGGGRYMVGVGDHWRIRRCAWYCAPGVESGAGGLRYFGGDDLMVVNSYCHSGDDTWQVVQAGAANDPFYNVSATNFYYIRCTGKSNGARYMIAALQDGLTSSGSIPPAGAPVAGRMDASITNGRFVECTGLSGKTAVTLKNTSSYGAIENVWFEDCVVDGSEPWIPLAGQPGAVYIEGQPTTGGVVDCGFRNTRVINHHRPGLRFTPSNADVVNLQIISGELQRGTSATTAPIIDVPSASIDLHLDNVTLNRRGTTATAINGEEFLAAGSTWNEVNG